MPDNPLIDLESVRKVYSSPDGPIVALDGVSLRVDAGQFVLVRGPSGSGKSTLLSLIAGLARPTSGQVRIAGADLTALGSRARDRVRARSIGMVFQLFHLLPYLSVLDNVLLSLVPRPERSAEGRREAEALLQRFGLGDRFESRPGELSVGQRQRVAVARALVHRPAILLADEPTGNLDSASARAVLDDFSRFREEGGTVVLVSHQSPGVDSIDQEWWLEAGRLRPASPSPTPASSATSTSGATP